MQQTKPEALLRIAEVQARTGISRSQLFELIRQGEFPKPIPLVGRTRAWVESDVSAWIAARIEAARAAGVRDERRWPPRLRAATVRRTIATRHRRSAGSAPARPR